MKNTLYLILFLGYIFIACATSKTTKVYIEVGVNDYTKRKPIAESNTQIKSKKIDSGMHVPVPSQNKSSITKKAN